MIIDAHTHIGEISFPVGKSRISSMPEKTLLDAIEKYSIDLALVSSIEGAEFSSDRELIPAYRQIPQLTSMQRVVDFVKKNRQRTKALLWVKPFTEERSSELDEFIRTNREFIAGLKIHPKLSNLEFRDKRIVPFIEMAGEFGFPILVHTEDDGRSNVGFVEEVANSYGEIQFNPSQGVLDEIISSGKLGMFRSHELRFALSSWSGKLFKVRLKEQELSRLRYITIDIVRNEGNLRRTHDSWIEEIGIRRSKFQEGNLNLLKSVSFEGHFIGAAIMSLNLNKYHYPTLDEEIDKILLLITDELN